MRGRPAKRSKRLFSNKNWEQCFKDFIAQLKSRNPLSRTAYQYECYLRRFFSDPAKLPSKYFRRDVERFVSEKTVSGEDPSSETKNARLTALRAFYEYAAKTEIKFGNGIRPLMNRHPPTDGIPINPRNPVSRAMSDDELTRFFAAIDTQRDPIRRLRDRALFLLYLWSGRRRMEIVSLYRRDIQRCMFRENGKLREGWLYSWRGKGHMLVDDSAEMPEDAMVALKEYLVADGRWEVMAPDDPIFPGTVPGKPLSNSHINVIFNQYATIAGITEKGIHRFRHTAAMARYEEKPDIVEVKDFLRHKSIETTLVYVQYGKRDGDSVAPRLHGRFGKL